MVPADPALATSRPPPAALRDGASSARGLIEGQLAMLSRLAEIGMGIAEALGREAQVQAASTADPSAAPSPERRRDPGLVFARVARAVRMTIALQSRLMKDLAALDRADALAEAARKDMRRMRLIRLIDQAARESAEARRAHLSPAEAWARGDDEDAVEDEIEQLSAEAYERLVDAEDGDLWGRPFDEVVAGVCADLGLSPEWGARLVAAVAAPSDHGGGEAPPVAGRAPAAADPPDPPRAAPPGAALVRPAAWPRAPGPDP